MSSELKLRSLLGLTLTVTLTLINNCPSWAKFDSQPEKILPKLKELHDPGFFLPIILDNREQSKLISQNPISLDRFVVKTLSTGEKVLRVPRGTTQQSPFLEATQHPLRASSNEINPQLAEGIFLWNGRTLKFLGYDIDDIFEFKIGNKTYWAVKIRAQDGSGVLEVSKPNFVNSRIAKINTTNYQFIRQIQRYPNQSAAFYVTIAQGNGLEYDVITYLIDLRLIVDNPNQNSVVCEASRYRQLRRGTSSVMNKPACKINP